MYFVSWDSMESFLLGRENPPFRARWDKLGTIWQCVQFKTQSRLELSLPPRCGLVPALFLATVVQCRMTEARVMGGRL